MCIGCHTFPMQMLQDIIIGLQRNIEQSRVRKGGIALHPYRLIIHRTTQAQNFSNDVVFDMEIISLQLIIKNSCFIAHTCIKFVGYLIMQIRISNVVVSIKTVVDVITITFGYRGGPMSVTCAYGKLESIQAMLVTGVRSRKPTLIALRGLGIKYPVELRVFSMVIIPAQGSPEVYVPVWSDFHSMGAGYTCVPSLHPRPSVGKHRFMTAILRVHRRFGDGKRGAGSELPLGMVPFRLQMDPRCQTICGPPSGHIHMHQVFGPLRIGHIMLYRIEIPFTVPSMQQPLFIHLLVRYGGNQCAR